MIEPATDVHPLRLRPDLERLVRLERATEELRALARSSDESPAHRRPLLAETVRAWERNVAAVRRRLPKAARR